MALSLANKMNDSDSTREDADIRALRPGDADPLIGEETLVAFQWVMYAFILLAASLVGAITNILNIICFVKQGLKDSVNVSLLGLAVSDLGCLLTTIGICICSHPSLLQSGLPVDFTDFAYINFGWPHIVFTRVTSWLTALITLERCVCITMPIKVKTLITSKRVTIVIVCIFILFTLTVTPVYYANRLAFIFSPERNRTILKLAYTDDRDLVDKISFAVNIAIIPFLAFVTIVICTVILVVNLRKKANWREKCVQSKNTDVMSKRDQNVAKMVVMISTVFIACFTPLCVSLMGMVLVPGLTIGGRYINVLYVVGGVSYLLESANSSANIFIYYNMSTKYRNIFQQLFQKKGAAA